MTTYYLYDSNGFYTGKTKESDTPVPNASIYEPKVNPGHIGWFDGYGWCSVPNTKSKDVSFEDARVLAYDMVAGLDFPGLGTGEYSPAERATFDAQYAEAKALMDGGESGVYLNAIAEETGESVEDLALKIVTKREASDLAQAKFAAKTQALRNRIRDAETQDDLPTYAEVMKLKKSFA